MKIQVYSPCDTVKLFLPLSIEYFSSLANRKKKNEHDILITFILPALLTCNNRRLRCIVSLYGRDAFRNLMSWLLLLFFARHCWQTIDITNAYIIFT